MRSKTRKAKETSVSSVMIDKEALARLAHELYLRRGGAHGHDAEDWLTAERILLEKKKYAVPHRSVSDASRRLEDKF